MKKLISKQLMIHKGVLYKDGDTIDIVMEDLSMSIKKFNNLLQGYYKESAYFRWLIRWENFKFDLRRFFKKVLPEHTKYIIYRIKNPKSPWKMN